MFVLLAIIITIFVWIPLGFFHWFGLDLEAIEHGFNQGQITKAAMWLFVYYGFHLFLLIRFLTSRRKFLYFIASCLIWVIAGGGLVRHLMMVGQ